MYKVDKLGNVTIIYSFTGGLDGSQPSAGLLLDSGGNLYGVTSRGGQTGKGVLFRIDPSGKESVVHNFDSTGGNSPDSSPVADGRGNVYGTTVVGGGSEFQGVLYRLNLFTDLYQVLHLFSGNADGSNPTANLSKDGSGHLYGVTLSGGSPSCNCGVVYEMSATTETVLHTFTTTDGANPNWLYRDPATGILYGTTTGGGTYGKGVLFRITP